MPTSAKRQMARDAMDGAIRAALVRAGDYLAQKLQDRLDEKNKNATGELRKSVVVTMPVMTDHGWSVKIGPTAKEAQFVVAGRRRGAKMPPVHAIENWITARGIQVHIEDAKSQDQAIRMAAWAIARSIAKNGIDPFPFIQDVWKEEKPIVRQMLRRSVSDAVKQINKGNATKGQV